MVKYADSPPITLDRLIALWKISAPVSIERELLTEISRLHGVIIDIKGTFDSVDKAWKEETNSHLVALHMLRVKLNQEPAVVGQHLKINKAPAHK